MSNVTVLLTRQEVADLIGVTLETIKMHRKNGTMPDPDHVYGVTPLWKPATIRAWDNTRNKRYDNRKG
jgi:hypothetical protein